MILIETDANGNTTFTRVPDLPSDYECDEWKTYDAACDQAQAAGLQWTQEQAETYAAYQDAMRAKSEG